MTEISMPLGAVADQTGKADKDSNGGQCRWNFTAFLCLAGGISFGAIGLFLNGIGYFSAAAAVEFNIGTTMVSWSIPLMLIGAHTHNRTSEETTKI